MARTRINEDQEVPDTIVDSNVAANAAIQLSKLGTGNLTLINQGSVIFKEQTGNGTDSVTIEAPDDVTTSYTLKLPPAQASGTQVLSNDGSGNLSWASAGTGSGTVNSGTAGRLSLYATSTNAVSDTYVQNTKNITLAIATQGSRSQNLALTIPNPGDAITAANVVLDQGAYTIVGQLTLSADLLGADGTVSLPGYSFSADTDVGLYRIGTDDIALATNGIKRLEISTTAITAALPLAMGSNKITGLANGTVSTDAAAYGQIPTFAASVQATASSSTSTSSTTYQSTGLSASITPLSASHRVKISVSWNAQTDALGGAKPFVTIFSGAGDLSTGGNGFVQAYEAPASRFDFPFAFNYIDSPATTSSVTYTVKVKSVGGNTVSVGSDQSSNGVIILEEIA